MTSNSLNAKISPDLIYFSFRAAWISAREALRRDRTGRPEVPAFLDRVPLLSGTAPQIQLAQLFRTWNSLRTGKTDSLDPVEQCVCYFATEELAQIGESDHRLRLEQVLAGPQQGIELDGMWLASKVRAIQITLPVRIESFSEFSNPEWILSSLDNPPGITRDTHSTEKSGNGQSRKALLSLVGSWQVSPGILADSAGLLTDAERRELLDLLMVQPCLIYE